MLRGQVLCLLQGKEHLRREGLRTSLRFSLADISAFAAAGSSSHGSRIRESQGRNRVRRNTLCGPAPEIGRGKSEVAITAFGMSKRAGGGWLAGLPLSVSAISLADVTHHEI